MPLYWRSIALQSGQRLQKAARAVPAQSVVQLDGSNMAATSLLFAPITGASPDRPFVVAQLGQSLDGRIATLSGDSQWINGQSALDHVHRLRAHVDAVVVGASTVVADNPMLTVRRVAGRSPARVVIDPNRRLDARAHVFSNDGCRRLIICTQEADCPAGVEAVVVRRSGRLLPPAEIIAELYRRGLKKIMIEGGASTISAFMDAGVIDRLHVLVAPVILGSGTTGLSLRAISGLSEAQRPSTQVHVLDDGDVLFDCDLRNSL
jgi:diaminohydroxyphosphoribosylaminopyrimidine deaminase / 5-amino-6-(5-phosphoribosylamino)uracil reductase